MASTPDIDMLKIIDTGLEPKGGAPKRVIIVGAGMAGLAAGYELLRAGHDPVILEGQNHVGGRVYTLREPFAPGLYAEAGAMRIPRAHDLTMAYVDKFALNVSDFTMANRNAYYYINGCKWRVKDTDVDPDCLGFDIAEHERGKSLDDLWAEALRPFAKRLEENGDGCWPEIAAEYD
ncbi:MAG: FAD-dependent oxidoreductase, partial [Chloroflexia bacterium]